MRIAHVVPTYIPAWRYGGPIRSVHKLCRALTETGNDVDVFTTNVNGERDSDVPLMQPVDVEGVNVRYYPSVRLRRLYWAPDLRTEFEARVRDYDVIHLHSVFLWPTLAAARVAQRAGVPYVVSPRGALVKDLFRRRGSLRKTLWMKLFEKRTLERAGAVHVTSTREADELRRFDLRLHRIEIVPNGLDVRPSFEHSDLPARLLERFGEDPLVVYLGRLSWEKGLDRLLDALPGLPRGVVVIAGNDDSNYQAQLEQRAYSLRVTERIVFTGPLSRPQVETLLTRASVLVLPSYSENFGNVVLEAMAAGCPVVVTEAVGAAEIVRESQAGIVVPGEPASLCAAIQRLIDDSDLRHAMGERGKTAIRERFTWRAIVARMSEVYRSLALRPGT